MVRDSSVDIVTRYGLEGPGVESKWRQDFPHRFRPAMVPNRAFYTMGTGSLSLKWPGRGVDHRTPSSADITERV
jgi:hypothetical protein